MTRLRDGARNKMTVTHAAESNNITDWVSHLLGNLRPRDREEVTEYGYERAHVESALRAPHIALQAFFTPGGELGAALWFDALTPRALVASMLATDAWPKVARAAYRYATREAPALLTGMGFVRAECRTMDGHDDAIRFLEAVGFTLECRLPQYGASGRSFLQYAWRLNDNVSLQITEGPAATSTSTDTGIED